MPWGNVCSYDIISGTGGKEGKMTERRHQKRIHKQLKIMWKNEDIAFDGITLDICPGGVFIVTNRLLPPKSIIDIDLWLGYETSVRCRGEVVWLNRGEVMHFPPGFGVQFLDISEEALNLLLPLQMEQDQDWEGPI